MTFSRRRMLQIGGAAAGGLMLPRRGSAAVNQWGTSSAIKNSLWAHRFTQTVAIPPVMDPRIADPTSQGFDYYKISAKQFTQALSPQMNAATRYWGYNIESPSAPVQTGAPQGYLGGIIIAQKGRPVHLDCDNKLTTNDQVVGTPRQHAIRVYTANGADNNTDVVDNTIAGSPNSYNSSWGQSNRITIHLHGGDPHWDSDGHPLTWFSNDPAASGNNHGQYWDPAYGNTASTSTGTQYVYPNNLSARMLWYHDHAESITRLNAYAGLATGYIIRDSNEAQLISDGNLPPTIESAVLGNKSGADIQEWPLVIQEKMFQETGTLAPQLYYHTFYDSTVWARTNNGALTLPDISCVPEMYGDVHMVNGVPWPVLQVKQGVYRFRILNASQARFFNLAIYKAKTGTDWDASHENRVVPNFTQPGPTFYQIGTEGGFLPAPVRLSKIMLGPAERVDVLVDFTNAATGKYVMYGAAPAPLPGGDPTNDYLMQTGVSGPGTIMMFDVIAGAPPAAVTLPTNLWPIATDKPAALNYPSAIMPVTLNEGWDEYGRLAQFIGNYTPQNDPAGGQYSWGGYGRPFLNVPGANNGLPIVWESHVHGQVEEWSILNTTGDVHPMHFHIVNVQIVSRQAIDTTAFLNTQTIKYLGAAKMADANERGWKETVRCYPGQITRVRMIFPPGYTGHYVWHCHILDHEEHDMMHEFELV